MPHIAFHFMDYEFLRNEYEEALSMQRKSRELYITKQQSLDSQIRILEKTYEDIKDKEYHKYVNDKLVSMEEYKKAKEDEVKKKYIASTSGKKYVRPISLCNIFAKIDAQKKAIIKNNDLARENIIIRKSNVRNTKYRREIIQDIEILQYKSAEFTRYITESTNCVHRLEKMLRYADYARENRLNVNFNNIFRLCNQHRNIVICDKLFRNGHKGTTSQCYEPCNKVMVISNDHRAKCECGSAIWIRSEVPSDQFDITSNTAEGKGFGGANFNPSLS